MPVSRSPHLRRILETLALTVVAVAAGACAADPPDAPVRTTSPSGSWTAPSAAQAAERDRALVRVIDAIPGVARLDVAVEGEKIVDGIEYKSITPYREVPSGRHPVHLRPAGMDTAEPLAEETHQFGAGRHYTVMIMPGEEGGRAAALRVLEDPVEPPGEGQARLRVVHTAADAGRVDVHLAGRQEPLATSLEPHRASEVTELQASPTAIDVRPAGRSESMLRVPDLRLSAGALYTIVLVGRARIDPPLETLLIEDRLAGQ